MLWATRLWPSDKRLGCFDQRGLQSAAKEKLREGKGKRLEKTTLPQVQSAQRTFFVFNYSGIVRIS